MPQIAEVIVDVPVMQTNSPYSYRIPPHLEHKLLPGMRVIVPFGQGDRKIQGFVVKTADVTEFDGQLKEISQIMDLTPVLSDELIQLGEKMANETFSFRISCYQTMLPAVLRAQYDKHIIPTEALSNAERAKLFGDEAYLSWGQAEEQGILDTLLDLKQQEQVDVVYKVSDRANKKMRKYVIPLLSNDEIEEALEQVRANATRQIELLEVFKQLDGAEILWSQLRDEYGVTSAVLNRAEEEQWCEVREVEVYRDPFAHKDIAISEKLELTPDQQAAYDQIAQSIQARQQDVFLLQGVTGSGKTEVYLQTIAQVLERGEGAIMLVPEIALTPQMAYRFKSRFQEAVAVLHSGLSDGEKYDEWRKIKRGEAKVVVGARSSIFAPIDHLGLIIIDEEHETTYKQEDTPRYHARDVAMWRAAYHSCPVILGSATPSLESKARAYKGVYQLLELPDRVNDKPLPPIEVVDMREEYKRGNRSSFSHVLMEQMQERINRGEQVVLLLNRRGYSSFMMCRDCGYVLECPNCDISQTLHMDTKTMKCHYCGHEEAIPQKCPTCQSPNIRYYGTGTQKIEEELQDALPGARIIRMDVDTTRRKGAHERLLGQFEDKEADILLGTQMIAKGLDFPNVTLVGVLNADTALGLPDFRSAESTFQLLTQVSGRAGRGQKDGRVIIQTFNPGHYAIQLAQAYDYETFFKKEMHLRRLSQYSPYYFLVRVMVSHEDELIASKKMAEIVAELRPTLSDEAIILGPTPKSIARTHNRYHFQTIIKYKQEDALKTKLHELLIASQQDIARGLYISIDPKPMNFI